MYGITLKRFCNELSDFREIMCNRKFWDDQGFPLPTLDKAFITLGSVYVCMEGTKADNDCAITLFEATSNEYMRRQWLMFHQCLNGTQHRTDN